MSLVAELSPWGQEARKDSGPAPIWAQAHQPNRRRPPASRGLGTTPCARRWSPHWAQWGAVPFLLNPHGVPQLCA